MKYNKFDNHHHHHDPHSVDYYAMMMQQKKHEKFLAFTIAIFTVLSLIDTYVGVSNLINQGTALAYVLLVVTALPIVSMIGGVLFLSIYKNANHPKRDTALTFTSVCFLLFAFIGNGLGVYHLIKLGTIAAYIVAAIVVCIVLYLAVKAVKSRVRGKEVSY